MKKISSLLLVLVMLLPCIVSCGSDDDDAKSKDSYYVKYEVKNGKRYVAIGNRASEWDITYKDVHNSGHVTTATSWWEGTYGPFKKGDKVTLRVVRKRGSYNAAASISVSKNNESFTIKAQGGGMNGADLSYTIDY